MAKRRGATAILILLAALVPFGVAEPAAGERVHIVANDYPPYEILQDDGTLTGTDVEVVRTALERMGYEVTFTYVPWARALRMAVDGDADALLSCAPTPQRREGLVFSDPISHPEPVVLVRADYSGPPLDSPANLGTRSLGTVRDYAYVRALKELGIPHDLSNTYAVAVRKLLDGRVDAVLIERPTADYLVKRMRLAGRVKWYPLQVPEAYAGDVSYHLCITRRRADAEELVRRFNRELARLMADGTYDAIHDRWR